MTTQEQQFSDDATKMAQIVGLAGAGAYARGLYLAINGAAFSIPDTFHKITNDPFSLTSAEDGVELDLILGLGTAFAAATVLLWVIAQGRKS